MWTKEASQSRTELYWEAPLHKKCNSALNRGCQLNCGPGIARLLIFKYCHLAQNIFRSNQVSKTTGLWLGHRHAPIPTPWLTLLIASSSNSSLEFRGPLARRLFGETFPGIRESLLHPLWHLWLVLLACSVTSLRSCRAPATVLPRIHP